MVIPIMTKDRFQSLFGGNFDVPKSDEAIIDLAEQLYSPEGRDSISDEESEYLYGTLFAALSNPEIEDSTVEAVLSAADADMPSLPNTYTSSHFKLYCTTNDSDPDNNVTLNDIKSTAAVLNNAWNDYSVNFKEPKHYLDNSKKWIDVYVYYLGDSTRGLTSSSWNYIELNSITVVSDSCRRQTTPVHELFHRVQYQYGYISGTAGMSWCVEGTASWSQKYMAPHVGD